MACFLHEAETKGTWAVRGLHAKFHQRAPLGPLASLLCSQSQNRGGTEVLTQRIFFKKGLKINLNSKKGAGLGNFEKWVPPAQ
jgi:hypothetical protein